MSRKKLAVKGIFILSKLTFKSSIKSSKCGGNAGHLSFVLSMSLLTSLTPVVHAIAATKLSNRAAFIGLHTNQWFCSHRESVLNAPPDFGYVMHGSSNHFIPQSRNEDGISKHPKSQREMTSRLASPVSVFCWISWTFTISWFSSLSGWANTNGRALPSTRIQYRKPNLGG